MVKIKDFTLASKNLGGHVPPMPYTPMDLWGHYINNVDTFRDVNRAEIFGPARNQCITKFCTMV